MGKDIYDLSNRQLARMINNCFNKHNIHIIFRRKKWKLIDDSFGIITGEYEYFRSSIKYNVIFKYNKNSGKICCVNYYVNEEFKTGYKDMEETSNG